MNEAFKAYVSDRLTEMTERIESDGLAPVNEIVMQAYEMGRTVGALEATA